jgi:NMD protein affecting ribosome stability and mRNA decay
MDRCVRCGMLPKHVGLGVCVECFCEALKEQEEIDAEHEAMVRELRDEAWYDHESDFVF